ncbi:IspD/TarI family cytidylyltransferase [Parasutterella secunda]|uniref:IspD/TarI family cytidylyltransferase n=1 Tax=Parasutterella secunda TaxID=626947 RepID=UPI0025A42F85|nr:IspD/TarI family cytidylyltransferase [Parasutterella secunda]MDM8217882.1 IspD/TarI family cytidylyltransferase [Parasutterella secunda]
MNAFISGGICMKDEHSTPVVAVIFAGGSGKRMRNSGLPKQFLELYGKPIIVYTLEQFQQHPEIESIVVSCIESHVSNLLYLVQHYNLTKVKKVVVGGPTGQISIFNALEAVEKLYTQQKKCIVLIHDGVRPLIDQETISKNILTVVEYGSCITCVPVIETVVLKNPVNKTFEIPARENSFLARAPQSFYLSDILSAHRKAIKDKMLNFTDSCSLMSYYGHSLCTTEGKVENIKITTPTDFYIFKAILDAKENSKIFGLL